MSATDEARLRTLLAPLFSQLQGQRGGDEVTIVMPVARLRRIRRALYPPSPRLAELTNGPRTAASETERRVLRAIEYPEGGKGAA